MNDGDALRSAERASFAVIGNFSLLRLVVLAVVALGLEGSPLVSLALARTPLTLAAGLVLLGVALAAQVVSNRFKGRSSGNLALLPLAELLSSYSLIRCGVLGVVRGGIVWRGTFYPTPVLRAGRRYGTAFQTLGAVAPAGGPRRPPDGNKASRRRSSHA